LFFSGQQLFQPALNGADKGNELETEINAAKAFCLISFAAVFRLKYLSLGIGLNPVVRGWSMKRL
jgi:hypothetical protein